MGQSRETLGPLERGGEGLTEIETRRRTPPGRCLVILGGGGSNWPPGILADPPTHPHQKITSQRLLDQSQAGVYMGKTPHTPHFGPIRVLYPKGLNC